MSTSQLSASVIEGLAFFYPTCVLLVVKDKTMLQISFLVVSTCLFELCYSDVNNEFDEMKS